MPQDICTAKICPTEYRKKLPATTCWPENQPSPPTGKRSFTPPGMTKNVEQSNYWALLNLRRLKVWNVRIPAPRFFLSHGKQIVFRIQDGDDEMGPAMTDKPGIYIADATGTDVPRFVSDNGENPKFSADGKRIYVQTGGALFWRIGQKPEILRPQRKG